MTVKLTVALVRTGAASISEWKCGQYADFKFVLT